MAEWPLDRPDDSEEANEKASRIKKEEKGERESIVPKNLIEWIKGTEMKNEKNDPR